MPTLPCVQPFNLILQNPLMLASSLAPCGCWQSHLKSGYSYIFFLKRSGFLAVMLIIYGALIVPTNGWECKQRPSQVGLSTRPCWGQGHSVCCGPLGKDLPPCEYSWDLGTGLLWGLTSRRRELKLWAK